MDQVKIAQAYSLLSALKENLPKDDIADEKYLNQFLDVIDALEQESGFDMKDFRIPFTPVEYRSGPKVTRSRLYEEPCERSFLMMRIDAVLKFFTIQSASGQSQSRAIGFNPR